jgi:branched-chain amino acid transport system permease protein
MAFALCGITTGAGGILVAPLINVTPEMGAVLGLKGFAAAAMGGMANPLGAAVGGLMLGTAEVVFAGVLWPGFHDIFAFLVLMAVLLIRPKGLTGPAQERIV